MDVTARAGHRELVAVVAADEVQCATASRRRLDASSRRASLGMVPERLVDHQEAVELRRRAPRPGSEAGWPSSAVSWRSSPSRFGRPVSASRSSLAATASRARSRVARADTRGQSTAGRWSSGGPVVRASERRVARIPSGIRAEWSEYGRWWGSEPAGAVGHLPGGHDLAEGGLDARARHDREHVPDGQLRQLRGGVPEELLGPVVGEDEAPVLVEREQGSGQLIEQVLPERGRRSRCLGAYLVVTRRDPSLWRASLMRPARWVGSL